MARVRVDDLQKKYSKLLEPRKGVCISRPVATAPANKAFPLADPAEMEFMEVEEEVVVSPQRKKGKKQASPRRGGKKAAAPKKSSFPGFPPNFSPPWIGTHASEPDRTLLSPKLAFESDHFTGILGLPSVYHLRYLESMLRDGGRRKLRPVVGDGDCLWSAVRRQLDIPLQYTNPMLRREVVWFVLENIQALFPLMKKHLVNLYGVEDPQGEMPGPFSILSYLEFLLKDGSWGDHLVLELLSRMWGARITVILSPGMVPINIRHDLELAQADIVLLLAVRHYSSTCEYFLMFDDGDSTVQL